MSWGAENFNRSTSKPVLEQTVRALPALAKQAFYSAAMRRGVIHRATWNGCAFNAGALEIGIDGVNSFAKAAEAFKCPAPVVIKFIMAWDQSRYETDEIATKALIEILERVGIFSEPSRPNAVVVQDKVFEGNMTEAQLLDKFKSELDTLDVTGFGEAYELLFKEPSCSVGT